LSASVRRASEHEHMQAPWLRTCGSAHCRLLAIASGVPAELAFA